MRFVAGRLLRETLLNLGAGLGVLCLLAAVGSIGFGVRPLVFRSGSMGPAIDTGALGLARTVPAAEVAVGDVVSVVDARGVRITHRVQTALYEPPTSRLTLRGDANPTADPEPYVVTEADRVFFTVNRVGYVVGALSTPWGTFGGGLAAGALLMYAFGRYRERPADAAPTTSPAATATVAVLALAVGAACAARPIALDTEAAFTNQVTARSGNFTTRTLTAPVVSCGTSSLGTLNIAWTAVTGSAGFTVFRTPSGSSAVTTDVANTPRTVARNGTPGEQGTIRIRARNQNWVGPLSNTLTYSFPNPVGIPTCST